MNERQGRETLISNLISYPMCENTNHIILYLNFIFRIFSNMILMKWVIRTPEQGDQHMIDNELTITIEFGELKFMLSPRKELKE